MRNTTIHQRKRVHKHLDRLFLSPSLVTVCRCRPWRHRSGDPQPVHVHNLLLQCLHHKLVLLDKVQPGKTAVPPRTPHTWCHSHQRRRQRPRWWPWEKGDRAGQSTSPRQSREEEKGIQRKSDGDGEGGGRWEKVATGQTCSGQRSGRRIVREKGRN